MKKMIFTLLIINLLTCGGSAFAGKEGGNGPGGDKKNESFTPMGIGVFLNHGNWSRNMEDWMKKHPVAMEACAQSPTEAFPVFPKELEGKIVVRSSKGLPLSVKDICSNKRLRKANSDLRFALTEVNSDKVFNYLLDKTISTTKQPVEIRLYGKRQKIPEGTHGKIEEFSWFDRESATIGFAPRRDADGLIDAITRRSEQAVLIHELGHVYTWRVLGGYGDAGPSHYNNKPLNNITDGGIFKVIESSNLYDFQTSPLAAFTEAFSNALEFEFSALGHPMVDDWTVTSFFYSESDKAYIWPGDDRWQKDLSSLLRNEPFLTSVLWHFTVRRVFIPEEAGNIAANPDILISLIDAIPVSGLDKKKPYTLFIRLLLGCDQVRKTNEGWRLSREHLFFDPRTGREIRNDFTICEDKDSLFKKYLCTDSKVPAETIFAPVLERNDKSAAQQQKTYAASKMSRQALLKIALEQAQKARDTQAELKEKIPAVLARMAPLRAYYGTRITEEKARSELAEQLQEMIGGMAISWIEVVHVLEFAADPKAGVKKAQADLEKTEQDAMRIVADIQQNPDRRLDDPVHIEQVEQYGSGHLGSGLGIIGKADTTLKAAESLMKYEIAVANARAKYGKKKKN